ncbi:hypothetical protein [Mesobacillus foraminis]|nr:hypothetical protein [Mesobacillus foraminis]
MTFQDKRRRIGQVEGVYVTFQEEKEKRRSRRRSLRDLPGGKGEEEVK